jgi:hypothetical protein
MLRDEYGYHYLLFVVCIAFVVIHTASKQAMALSMIMQVRDSGLAKGYSVVSTGILRVVVSAGE